VWKCRWAARTLYLGTLAVQWKMPCTIFVPSPQSWPLGRDRSRGRGGLPWGGGTAGTTRFAASACPQKSPLLCHLDRHTECLGSIIQDSVRTRVERLQRRQLTAASDIHKICLHEGGRGGSGNLCIRERPGRKRRWRVLQSLYKLGGWGGGGGGSGVGWSRKWIFDLSRKS
jgi:hypothetical protein